MVAALALAACAGRQSQQPADAGENVRIVGTDYKFEPDHITVKAGKINFTVLNNGQVAHNFKIPEKNVGFAQNDPGQSTTVTVVLEPGTYRFVCDLPGHQERGMVGTITVVP